jgi:hypothetical protein
MFFISLAQLTNCYKIDFSRLLITPEKSWSTFSRHGMKAKTSGKSVSNNILSSGAQNLSESRDLKERFSPKVLLFDIQEELKGNCRSMFEGTSLNDSRSRGSFLKCDLTA